MKTRGCVGIFPLHPLPYYFIVVFINSSPGLGEVDAKRTEE